MSSSSQPAYEIIENEKDAYLEELPEVNPEWPPDVRVVYNDLLRNLFEPGLRIGRVYERNGLYNNNISTYFRRWVGQTPKDFMTYHRLELSKRLLPVQIVLETARRVTVALPTVAEVEMVD